MAYRPSSEDPLLLLAMDHRASLGKSLYDVKDDDPTPGQVAAMEAGKSLVHRGLAAATGDLPGGHPGVLVDERYGRAVIEEVARSRSQTVLAIPIEHSGQNWFGLEWGGLADTTWTDHLQAVQPDFAKVLVRDNPAFDEHDRQAQLTHLRTVSDLLGELGVPLLYELLVPATEAQMSSAGGSAEDYDRDLRPELVTQVIADNHEAGVYPAIWKIEGLETADAARAVVAAARSGGTGSNAAPADCIVLGRDAPQERLDHWLEVAAPVDGFVGFAIGRSIWEQPLKASLAGQLPDEDVPARVAEAYLHYAGTYLSARSS